MTFTVVSLSFCDHLVFSFCRKEKWFLHFHFFFFFYSPWTFDFFENFDQIPWHVGSLDGQMPHWLALQRASNPPIHQRLFKNFPMHQNVYSKCKYPGFAESRPAAQRPTARDGPVARRPEGPSARGPRPATAPRPGGPEARWPSSDFPVFLSSGKSTRIHSSASG